jgi:16S rRNA (guanine1207-N2)-methyltransferase
LKPEIESQVFCLLKGAAMSHYFSAHPDVTSEPFTFKVEVFNQTFQFHSDHGVFSKDHLDFASRLLIESVVLEPTDEVLDLGTGIGIIGLLLEAQFKARFTLVDINERALELARLNQKAFKSNANIVKSDGMSALKDQRFHHIITNPPIRIGKQKLYEMLENATNHLVPGGSLWVVMHKKHGVESLIHFMEKNHRVEPVIRKKGFRVLKIQNAN